MLSDTCFELINQISEAIKDYDYADQYEDELTEVIKILNNIKDELDRGNNDKNLLKNNDRKARVISERIYQNSILSRDMSSKDCWDDVYKDL